MTEQRIGNIDREKTVTRLQKYFTDGYLDHEEFEDRVAKTLTAKTGQDLAVILGDLGHGKHLRWPVPVAAIIGGTGAAVGVPFYTFTMNSGHGMGHLNLIVVMLSITLGAVISVLGMIGWASLSNNEELARERDKARKELRGISNYSSRQTSSIENLKERRDRQISNLQQRLDDRDEQITKLFERKARG